MADAVNEHSDIISLKLNWEGIGDIVVCATILHGLAEQHSGKEVRFYLSGGLTESVETWLKWAKLWWSNAFNGEKTPLAGKVYELGNPEQPDNDPELTMRGKQFRHVLWAEMCGTKPRRFECDPSTDSKQAARALLQSIGLDLDRPIVYLSPVTNALERNWPMKRWRQLEEEILATTDVQVLVGASRYRRWATRRDFQAFKTPYFLGSYPPDVLIGVMSMMSCIISNDSGFGHLGGIMNIPTVAICGGPYDGNVVFGWYGGVRVVQSPSGCIRQVRVNSVLSVVRKIFPATTLVHFSPHYLKSRVGLPYRARRL